MYSSAKYNISLLCSVVCGIFLAWIPQVGRFSPTPRQVGSGLVSCELAKVTHHVTGIDITPAMIEQANLLRQEKNLWNIKYEIGDVTHLPYGERFR